MYAISYRADRLICQDATSGQEKGPAAEVHVSNCYRGPEDLMEPDCMQISRNLFLAS